MINPRERALAFVDWCAANDVGPLEDGFADSLTLTIANVVRDCTETVRDAEVLKIATALFCLKHSGDEAEPTPGWTAYGRREAWCRCVRTAIEMHDQAQQLAAWCKEVQEGKHDS